MGETFFSKGNKCFRNREYENAIDFYKKSISECHFSYCFENMAWTYLRMGDFKKAHDSLLKAIDVSNDIEKNRIKTNWLYKRIKSDMHVARRENIVRLSVRDLKTKLWGGFSVQAQKDLLRILKDEAVASKDKAIAAVELARWYAAHNEWGNTKKFLEKLREVDVKIYRDKKIKLLLIETYINLGMFDKANKMIEFVLSQRVDGDFVCALNNLILLRDGRNGSTLRLEALNRIYNNFGLSPLKLIENSKGLMFGNIDYNSSSKEKLGGPKISILVPVYNAEMFIDVAIESLLNQTWKNIEIIAIDDCSSDGSFGKMQELAKRDGRLKIYKNEKNLGAYPTRNKAFNLATGAYITVHDSDDWSHPQMLEVQMDVMLQYPKVKITCSAMTRAYQNLKFILRPQRENLEYIHRSYPSVLIKREDMLKLGEWDGVLANADDDLVQRARVLWGRDSIVDVLSNVPLSYFLVHKNSLTQQEGTSLNTLTFGIRKEYARQAIYWRSSRTREDGMVVKRTSLKDPFPIPQGLAPKNWPKNTHYDLIFISDLSLLGGTRRCNEGYIAAASEMGWRVGLFHWPRYDLKSIDIAKEYLDLTYQDNVDILVPEDEVTAEVVIIHHPPILKYEIDAVPKILCKKVGILVNQSPMQLWSQEPFYYHAKPVEALIQKLFGRKPTWIAISPRVIQTLGRSGGVGGNLYSDIWYPPYLGHLTDDVPALPVAFGSSRKIKLGRHSRDHWTKWPNNTDELKSAYCANSDKIEVYLLGGAQIPEKILGEMPKNWRVFKFDSVNVPEFIKDLDFFVHYTHPDYIEEFGRNIMEAMAAGKVVILPLDYKEVFGEAAVYASPEDVESVILRYWRDVFLYERQAAKGFQFVKKFCAKSIVQNNLMRFRRV